MFNTKINIKRKTEGQDHGPYFQRRRVVGGLSGGLGKSWDIVPALELGRVNVEVIVAFPSFWLSLVEHVPLSFVIPVCRFRYWKTLKKKKFYEIPDNIKEYTTTFTNPKHCKLHKGTIALVIHCTDRLLMGTSDWRTTLCERNASDRQSVIKYLNGCVHTRRNS